MLLPAFRGKKGHRSVADLFLSAFRGKKGHKSVVDLFLSAFRGKKCGLSVNKWLEVSGLWQEKALVSKLLLIKLLINLFSCHEGPDSRGSLLTRPVSCHDCSDPENKLQVMGGGSWQSASLLVLRSTHEVS